MKTIVKALILLGAAIALLVSGILLDIHILWAVGSIASILGIIFFLNEIEKKTMEKIGVVIYALTIPLWIFSIFYYSNIKTTILFLALTAYASFVVYFGIKEWNEK